MITYFLNSEGIFHVTFSETVTVEDMKSYLHEFEKLSNLPQNLLAFYDLRNANIKLSHDDLISISELTDKVTNNYKTIRTAFLVDKPSLTAYSIIFSEKSGSGRVERKVFSTESAALNWLK